MYLIPNVLVSLVLLSGRREDFSGFRPLPVREERGLAFSERMRRSGKFVV